MTIQLNVSELTFGLLPTGVLANYRRTTRKRTNVPVAKLGSAQRADKSQYYEPRL
jgi:hypothetical protein